MHFFNAEVDDLVAVSTPATPSCRFGLNNVGSLQQLAAVPSVTWSLQVGEWIILHIAFPSPNPVFRNPLWVVRILTNWFHRYAIQRAMANYLS